MFSHRSIFKPLANRLYYYSVFICCFVKITIIHFRPFESPDIPIKKLKNEVKDEKELKEDKALENKIEKQNKLFDKHRNALMNTNKNDVEKILEYNLQGIPTGKTEVSLCTIQ